MTAERNFLLGRVVTNSVRIGIRLNVCRIMCQADEGRFREIQFIATDDSAPGFVNPVRQILTGRIRGTWEDQFNRKALSVSRASPSIRSMLRLASATIASPGPGHQLR